MLAVLKSVNTPRTPLFLLSKQTTHEVHRPLGDDKNSKKQTRIDLLRVLWSKINVFTGG